MRASSVFLTLAYAASFVMAAPVSKTTSAAASATETASKSSETVSTYSHCNRPGVFALTFDDGPDKYSWGLAKSLHEQGIKATFFINGNNSVDVLNDSTTTDEGEKSYLEVIKHYYDLGHEIASHTLSHTNLVDLTEEEVKKELDGQSDIIYQAIGKRVRGFRPPEGVTDAVSSKVLKDLGYYNVLWDLDTQDWQKKGLAYEQKQVKAVLDKDVANKTMGHIALEHDIHEATVTTLVPWLTEYVQKKGYEFVTVSDCLGLEPYQIEAGSNITSTVNGTAHEGTTINIDLSTYGTTIA